MGGTAKGRNEPGKRGGEKEGKDLHTLISGDILMTRFCALLINESR